MRTRLYLDTRKTIEGKDAPLYLIITHKGTTSYLPLGVSILPSRWDSEQRRLKQLPENEWPQRNRVRRYIESRTLQIESILIEGEQNGELHGLKADGIRDYVLSKLYPSDAPSPSLFCNHLRLFADRHGKRTKEIYLTTLARLHDYMGDDAEQLTFEDITTSWLHSFDSWLSVQSPSPNARAIHLRNLRAVINDAIDAELTTNYPFRRYKIKSVETEKRSMSVAQLKAYLNAPCPTTRVAEYRDIFSLIFCLIGINVVDLYNLQHKDYREGRIHYVRSKTHKAYSIKVEPEAAEIIERHRGKKNLLNLADRFANHTDYMRYLNRNLKRVGEYTDIMGNLCRPFGEITSYWARHSWATIAINDLDIPKETVSAALGHEMGNRITSVYIDFDRRKVDDANRRVLDIIYK